MQDDNQGRKLGRLKLTSKSSFGQSNNSDVGIRPTQSEPKPPFSVLEKVFEDGESEDSSLEPSSSGGSDNQYFRKIQNLNQCSGLNLIDNGYIYEDSGQEDLDERSESLNSHFEISGLEATSSNNLLLNIVDDLESKNSADYICRICHGGDSFDDLMTPCSCRGSIALVHLRCLERWLRESSHSYCELCQHHYKIIREPKYSIPWSVLVFLRHPGAHLKELLMDLVAFALYTPSAVASTYMLMMICESLVKNNVVIDGSISSHIVAFSAVFGMAAIDFTYSSWLMVCLQKHFEAWREWYRNNSSIKIVLPAVCHLKSTSKRGRTRQVPAPSN